MEQQIEVVKKEAAGLMAWANNLVVATADDYKGVVARLQDIKAIRKKWTDYWLPLKTTAHESWKGIVAKEKEGTDVCDAAKRTAKIKALTWKQEADRKAAEEQRKLQAEADERARKERERLEKEAAKLKTPEKQAERLEQAAAVEAPVVTVQSAAAEITGASGRKTWKAEVVDKAALIAAAVPGSVAESLLEVNQEAADSFAKSTKGSVAVPGVKFHIEEGLSIRGTNG